MTRRIIWLLVAVLVFVALYYVSRFWPVRLWGREGLFGIQALRPQGGLVAVWLRGTPLAAYELLVWAVGSVLLLTGLQWVYDLVAPKED